LIIFKRSADYYIDKWSTRDISYEEIYELILLIYRYWKNILIVFNKISEWIKNTVYSIRSVAVILIYWLRREWRILIDNNSVIDINTDEEIAIKFKYILVNLSFFREEIEIYKFLIGDIEILIVYWFGWECEYRIIIFEFFEFSLEDFFNYCGRQFSFKTILIIAD
jgi:hypothetical protein